MVNGLLSSNNTWSGNNNFTTQTLGDNSTLAATTAFVIANSSESVGGLLGSTNTWTGTSNTFNNKIVMTDIESLSTTRCNLFNNIDTGIIVIGEGQTSGQLYLGTKFIGRTGSVQIGCTTCDTVSRGPFKANIGISLQGATNYINCDTNSAAISFFDTLTTGNLNIAKNISTGYVNLFNSFQVVKDGFNFYNNSNSFNLFNNLTAAVSLNIGGSGTVNIGNNSEGLTQIGKFGGGINIGAITSSIANNINIGNSAISNTIIGDASNDSAAFGTGCCRINKLQVGINGSIYRCVIIQRNVTSGISGLNTYTIPGAPTGYGDPLVFATILSNITSGFIFAIQIDVNGPTTFRYWKRLQTGSTTSNASEGFNYVAYWL